MPVPNQFFGLYRGIVAANDDPESIMRITAYVPEVLGEEITTDWALPCVPPGIRLIPEINTNVWIAFEAGDPSRPIWVGTTGGSAISVVGEMQDNA